MVKELREKTGVGHDEVQEGAGRGRRRPGRGREAPAQAGRGDGRQEGRPGHRRGLVDSYIHTGGKIGVLLEVNCETDFAARSDDFQAGARTSPCTSPPPPRASSRREDVPEEVLADEREIAREQALKTGQARERSSRRSSTARSKVLRRDLPAGAAVRQGSGQDRRAAGHRRRGQDRREHPGPPFRPLRPGGT